ncbi:hypothetical protein [Desulfosediminicola ganghwensis]|uniref:hypothetical protein n=1 Tax=Desulfosediminicola ganghwensis TaxID=2569540 RepID=UPI0010AB8E4C|nr:hypothetical protein [Desulfosediminicola ganghwensis]
MRKGNKQNLEWSKKQRGTWIATEMIRSDAFRVLTSTEKEILLYLLTLRQFPKGRKRDYWNPINKNKFKAPVIGIKEFFDGSFYGMKSAPPHHDTIRKAFVKLMAVGFISLKYQGGNGPEDQNLYGYENEWRTWKKGDPPCFEKDPMAFSKGFCQPGSGKYYTKKSK